MTSVTVQNREPKDIKQRERKALLEGEEMFCLEGARTVSNLTQFLLTDARRLCELGIRTPTPDHHLVEQFGGVVACCSQVGMAEPIPSWHYDRLAGLSARQRLRPRQRLNDGGSAIEWHLRCSGRLSALMPGVREHGAAEDCEGEGCEEEHGSARPRLREIARLDALACGLVVPNLGAKAPGRYRNPGEDLKQFPVALPWTRDGAQPTGHRRLPNTKFARNETLRALFGMLGHPSLQETKALRC